MLVGLFNALIEGITIGVIFGNGDVKLIW